MIPSLHLKPSREGSNTTTPFRALYDTILYLSFTEVSLLLI